MKVLRIFDHLGELKKEFNLYVEGEDFKWQSSYPEPLWLGTIALEEAGKEPEAEPTPEPEIVKPEPMVAIQKVEEVPEKPSESVSEPLDKTPEEVYDAIKKLHRKRSRVKRSSPPASPGSFKELHQRNSPGATSKGD